MASTLTDDFVEEGYRVWDLGFGVWLSHSLEVSSVAAADDSSMTGADADGAEAINYLIS